jgi:hypothetical protein
VAAQPLVVVAAVALVALVAAAVVAAAAAVVDSVVAVRAGTNPQINTLYSRRDGFVPSLFFCAPSQAFLLPQS